MQQYVNETNEQRIARLERAKTDCRERHDQFMQFADAVCDTTHHRALVKPSGHTQERHTDEYNIRELPLTTLLDVHIRMYRDKYKCFPLVISLSRINICLLSLQGYNPYYWNKFGAFRLACDTTLGDDKIRCS